jgi:nicotinamidase-related amidase
MQRVGKELLLEMLLAGSPGRILDALAAFPEDAADLVALRDEIVELASSAAPARPSAALRARLLASRPQPLRPQHPVVIVLDMINDHLRPGVPLEVPRARDIVPALKARLAEARKSAIPVLYVCDRHASRADPDFGEWPVHALEGTDGADVWPDLAPEPGDRIVTKPTYSAFTGSELPNVLESLGADSIILTGCATEVGMHATAVDALQRGYVVQIPPDSQAGMSMLGEMAALITLSTMPPYDPIYLRGRTRSLATPTE